MGIIYLKGGRLDGQKANFEPKQPSEAFIYASNVDGEELVESYLYVNNETEIINGEEYPVYRIV